MQKVIIIIANGIVARVEGLGFDVPVEVHDYDCLVEDCTKQRDNNGKEFVGYPV